MLGIIVTRNRSPCHLTDKYQLWWSVRELVTTMENKLRTQYDVDVSMKL